MNKANVLCFDCTVCFKLEAKISEESQMIGFTVGVAHLLTLHR